MRILISAFACQPNRGSEPGVGWEWATALARISDHEVTVLTNGINRAPIERHLAGNPVPRLRFRYIDFDNPFRRFGSPGHYLYYYLWQARALLALLRTGEWRRFDLIHHLTYGGIRTGSLLCLLPRLFMFGPVGGGEGAPPRLSARLGPGKVRLERLRMISNLVARIDPVTALMQLRATRILAKTRETARCFRLGGRKVHVRIEIGAPPRPALVPRSDQGEPLRILFGGKLLYWKGCDFLLDAMALLDAPGANMELVVVGGGEREAAIAAKAAALRHIPATLTGQVPQSVLFDQYARADLFVFPSLHDSSGNVVLEAMTFGLPVICFDLGGPPLIVGNGGIAVPVTDADHDQACRRLADTIAALRDDPARRAALAEAAARRAATLTWAEAVRGGYGPLLFAADPASRADAAAMESP
jgi:glycosyltransferase involved in cell wall biosynthesis